MSSGASSHSRPRLALLGLCVGAALATSLFWLLPAPPQSPASEARPAALPTTEVEANTAPAAAAAPTSTPPATPVEPPPPPVEPTAAPVMTAEVAYAEIETLATSYDASYVPALARFLAHPEPEVREAAREGLLTLGERAAIPFLEAAATSATGAEATALREAAAYLALPTWREYKAARKNPTAASALPSGP